MKMRQPVAVRLSGHGVEFAYADIPQRSASWLEIGAALKALSLKFDDDDKPFDAERIDAAAETVLNVAGGYHCHVET